MDKLISIFAVEEELDLKPGKHNIDIVGGWGVILGEFSLSFTHKQSGQIVYPHRSQIPAQSFVFNKRAKRVFTLDITEAGIYRINFIKPETIIVKSSNLFFTGLFQHPIPNHNVSVYIQ